MIKKILNVSTLLSILTLATTTTLYVENVVNACEKETIVSEATEVPQDNTIPEIPPQDNVIPETTTQQDTTITATQNTINLSKDGENIIVTRNGKNIIISQNNDNKTLPNILAEETLDNGEKIIVLETTEGKIQVVVESYNENGEREVNTYNEDDLVDADF